MKRADSFDEDPDDDEFLADEEFVADEEELDTRPCPYCGHEVAEIADVCPKCRSYISLEDAPPPRKPLWWIVVVVILALTMIGVGVML